MKKLNQIITAFEEKIFAMLSNEEMQVAQFTALVDRLMKLYLYRDKKRADVRVDTDSSV